MIIAHKGVEYKTRLETQFNNYNCSVKMVGILKVLTEPKDERLTYDTGWWQKVDDNRRVLIQAWIASLEDRNTFSELREGNKIFPLDTGKYLPTVLLFADAINGYAATDKWYKSFLALVREFQKDPSYGMTVVPLPAYHNRTYGVYGQPRFSRVFALYPPTVRQYMFTPANKELNKTFQNKAYADLYTKEDKEEYLAALG